MNPTTVRVRAQAHGGKFIGPAIPTAPVLSVLVGGKPVIAPVTFPNQSSGTVVSAWQAGVSPHPIVVEPPPVGKYYPAPGTYWLEPPAPGLADVVVSLDLTEPTAVEFRVEAFSPSPVYGSVTLTLTPGQSLTGEPGVVVPVWGLYTPSFTAQRDASTGLVNIAATVQMMCGCPITQQPRDTPVPQGTEPYWPSTEFEVTAFFVQPLLPPVIQAVALACTATNQFTASIAVPGGATQAWLHAVQPATGNVGSAVTTVG